MKLQLIIGASLLGVTAFGQAFSESFDDLVTSYGDTTLTALQSRGWSYNNLSTSGGYTSWFGGETSYVAADQSSTTNTINAGSNTGYIAANYNNTAPSGGTISNYLFTPTTTLHNGDKISFETISDGYAADNLQVLLSTSGSSTDASAFSKVLLEINPTLDSSGYATTWTKYTLTLSGLSGSGLSGKFAFRYYVTNGGLYGANSSYIGLDNVEYSPVPEPASMAVIGVGLVALIRRRKNSR